MPKHIFLFPFHQKEEIVKLMIFEKSSQNVWPLGKMEVMLNIILLSFSNSSWAHNLLPSGGRSKEDLGSKIGQEFKTHLAPETFPLPFSETSASQGGLSNTHNWSLVV